MARSLYKGARLGSRPPCLLCMGPGTGERAPLRLSHGVSVWLCEAHRSPAFVRRRAGRDLVRSLMGAWEAAGCLSAARSAALDGLLAAIRGPAPRARPGSYAWPELRREAEARIAAGQEPGAVIGLVRGRIGPGPARAPSVRTLQRWIAQGRWRSGGATGGAPPPPPSPRRTRRTRPGGAARPRRRTAVPRRPTRGAPRVGTGDPSCDVPPTRETAAAPERRINPPRGSFARAWGPPRAAAA